MKKLILVAFLNLLTIAAFAGVSTSGGGYAVVCRDLSKQIITTELLDLVEGRLRYNLEIFEPSGSAVKDYSRSVENTYFLQTGKPFQGCGLSICEPSEMYSRFMKIIDWVDSKNNLDFMYDIGDVSKVVASLKQGCDIEQVAIFNDLTNRVQIAKDAWQKMDSLSQAALIQHELWYREARKFVLLPESNSERSRLNTAIQFSNTILPVTDGLPKDAKEDTVFHDLNRQLNGRFDATSHWTFKVSGPSEEEKNIDYNEFHKKQIFRTQFSNLGGRTVLTKTYVDIPGGVAYGQKYPIISLQFQGWYVLIMLPQSSQNLTGVAVRVFDEKNEAVTDIQ